jgi:hypothetical protein
MDLCTESYATKQSRASHSIEKFSNSILNQKLSTRNKRTGTLCTESYATKQVE